MLFQATHNNKNLIYFDPVTDTVSKTQQILEFYICNQTSNNVQMKCHNNRQTELRALTDLQISW